MFQVAHILIKYHIMFIKRNHFYLHTFLIIFFSLILGGLNSYAQEMSLTTKNNFLESQRRTLQDTINRKTNIDYPFIVGYFHKPVRSEFNHPYFSENKWVNGSLHYNGISYNVEGLKYDIENDKLIFLKQDYEMNCIELSENSVNEFTILNSTFIYYTDLKTDVDKKLKSGYYEVIYNGKLKFLVRTEKVKALNNYSSSTRMFLLKDGEMISIKSMSKLIGQLKDKKKDIKKFIFNNSLRLNESNYISAFEILKFYENL